MDAVGGGFAWYHARRTTAAGVIDERMESVEVDEEQAKESVLAVCGSRSF
jgi:hypothetical protein